MKTVFVTSLALVALASSTYAQAPKPEYFSGMQDLSVFLKTRFNFVTTGDQQFGIRAKIVKYGNASAEFSFAYDPNYPINFNVAPRWTTGVQFAYFFLQAPFPLAVYTTPKYNLVNTWKQEFGLNARWISTPHFYANSSLDYQPTYPDWQRAKPTYQLSLTLGFPLGGLFKK